MSKQTICHTIYREILRSAQDMMGVRLTLQVNPEIAELLHREESDAILSLEQMIGKQIVVYPNMKFHLEQFEIFEVLTE